MKRLGAIGAVILMAITAAGVFAPHIDYLWDIPPSIGVPIMFIIMFGGFWLAAYIYEHKWAMFEYELRGEMKYNCFSLDHINVFEEMCFIHLHIPIMKSLYALLPEGDVKTSMYNNIKKIEDWTKRGYIPKKDFPPHLQKFIRYKQTRL